MKGITSRIYHWRIFIYLRFYVAFNTVQVKSQWVVGRAEETSTYSSLGLCTVNFRPTASNYQLSHLRLCWGSNPGLRGGRREYYHSGTVAPPLASSVPPETFQFVTFTSNDNKEAEYTCFCYKKHVE